MIKPSEVTIIIPHLGADEQQEYSMDQCLISLRETAPEIKRIVAINGSKCPERFDQEEEETFINLSEQGQCKAVNAAVATINTPWIFITNDDMIYAPGWWERLTDFSWFGEKPIGCVSPQLVEPRAGAPTFQVQPFGGAGGDFDKEKWLEFAKKWAVATPGKFRTGFNLPFIISKELWDLIGGYDINYDPWGSNGDSDLEYKIKLAGVQPYQSIDAIVYHFSQTSGTFHPDNDTARFRNYAYFKEKWGFDRTDDGIWEATFRIPTKEEGRIFSPDWEGKYANT